MLQGEPAQVAAAPARCVPFLSLRADTLFVEDGSRRGDEVRTAVMRLDFTYGDRRVRSGGSGRAGRDPAAEAAACRILESLGAIELSSLEDVAVTPGSYVDYVVAIDADPHQLCAFGAYALPQLRDLGWTIQIAPDYPWQVVAASAPLYCAARADNERPDWFGVELGVEIDGRPVDLLPALLDLLDGATDLDALLRTSRRCIAVRVDESRWLTIPPAQLARLGKVLVEMYRNGPLLSVPATRLPAVADLCAALHEGPRGVRWTGDGRIRDRAYALALGPRVPTAKAPATAIPASIQATLRGYQQDGVAWLQHLRANDAGGILADDMGLGKTLQTITHIACEKEQGRIDRPCMIVTLTSLVGNWQREFARFAPGLRVIALHGPERHARRAEMTSGSPPDVVITTYPLVARDTEELVAIPLHLLVLDEAHAIKNHSAQAAAACRKLDARHRVCLSGTPIENHLGELWSLLDFCNPGLLGSRDEFATQFRAPIEEKADRKALDQLRERVRPFVLRRTKENVAPELPPKTCLVRAVDLTPQQRELYESIRVAAHADVRNHIKQRGLARSTIAVLDALLKLRQVCCDPRLVTVEAAKGVEGSAKLDTLLQMIDSGLAEGRRFLVFSQFARMLGLISEALLARGHGHVTLTGGTPDRQKPIDAFQQGRADIFLISLKAGGAGLNLVGADTVIHYDPWWNPAAQAQATDRAHRIGQDKPVFVHDLIAAGSVEERMLSLQKHKRALASSVLDAGPSGTNALSESDIDELLAPLAPT